MMKHSHSTSKTGYSASWALRWSDDSLGEVPFPAGTGARERSVGPTPVTSRSTWFWCSTSWSYRRYTTWPPSRSEYQIRDWFSFARLLGLGIEHEVPDAPRCSAFVSDSKESELLEQMFNRFDGFLASQGIHANRRQIILMRYLQTKARVKCACCRLNRPNTGWVGHLA